MNIQREHLHDEEAYLKERMQTLLMEWITGTC